MGIFGVWDSSSFSFFVRWFLSLFVNLLGLFEWLLVFFFFLLDIEKFLELKVEYDW